MYRATFADGSVLRVRHDREDMAAEIREFAGRPRRGRVRRVLRMARRDVLDRLAAIHRQATTTTRGRPHGDGGRSRGCSARAASSGFDSLAWRRSSRTSACSACSASTRSRPGVAPHDALAMLAVRTYMESVGGVFTARGGMHAVATALARAIADAGAYDPVRHAGDAHPARRRQRRDRCRDRRLGAARRRRRRLQPRSARRLPHAARWHRCAAGRAPRQVRAVVPAVGRRRAGRGPRRTRRCTTCTSATSGRTPSRRSSSAACA